VSETARASSLVKAAPFQEITDDTNSRSARQSLPCLCLSVQERAQLLRWTRARTSAHRLVVRSRIILMASEGRPAGVIAARLHVSRATVRLWCDRFSKYGVAALERERSGRGRRPGMSPRVVAAVLRTMQTPPQNAGGWTTRALATAAGTSASTVCRIRKRYSIVALPASGSLDGRPPTISDP
jgi:transposase